MKSEIEKLAKFIQATNTKIHPQGVFMEIVSQQVMNLIPKQILLVLIQQYLLAADELLKWVYVKDKKLKGLVKRRQLERAVFLGEVDLSLLSGKVQQEQ